MSEEVIKYFGFWPATTNHFAPVGLGVDDSGFISDSTKSLLLEKTYEAEGAGWKFAVTGDYLCMLHLEEIEAALRVEQEKNADAHITTLSFGSSRSARFEYTSSLNALQFLIFCACFTGRGLYTLHDYDELTVWNTARFQYDLQGNAIKGGGFPRYPEQQLRRLKLLKIENDPSGFKIDPRLFKDVSTYWSIVYDAGLVKHAAVGSKLISEHRNEDTRACVGLTWFEIEKWLTPFADELGIDVYKRKKNGDIIKDQTNGTPMYKIISDIVKSFPEGTWISSEQDDLLKVAWLRNQVAHKGYTPSIQESAFAIDVFIKMFNFRTGLALRADTNRTPTSSVS